MTVLNSSTAFHDHYAKRAGNAFTVAAALGTGAVAGGGFVGASAAAASAAAINASAWSAFTSWPLIGGLAAGKAAAAGSAAAAAAATSAVVLLPAIALGGGVAAGIIYLRCRNRKKKTLHKGSQIEVLADAFARVACLPAVALAVSICQSNPANVEAVEGYFKRTFGSWGYSEEYIRNGFAEAMKHSPEEINGVYEWSIGELASGKTEETFGVMPSELPVDAVRGFAEEFKKEFEQGVS